MNIEKHHLEAPSEVILCLSGGAPRGLYLRGQLRESGAVAVRAHGRVPGGIRVPKWANIRGFGYVSAAFRLDPR